MHGSKEARKEGKKEGMEGGRKGGREQGGKEGFVLNAQEDRVSFRVQPLPKVDATARRAGEHLVR